MRFDSGSTGPVKRRPGYHLLWQASVSDSRKTQVSTVAGQKRLIDNELRSFVAPVHLDTIVGESLPFVLSFHFRSNPVLDETNA